MNINKHAEFFNPISDIKGAVHVIGCGAIGSHIAETLTRMGAPHLHLYDFDIVTEHNLANQMFRFDNIGRQKTSALREVCQDINPEAQIEVHPKGWLPDATLSGYIFLCVDNIEIRKAIIMSNEGNPFIKGYFDFRIRLTDAQHYASDNQPRNIKQLLETMNFTSAEAKAATPVSACGTTLNIIPTVRLITALGLANFINMVKDQPWKKMILADAFSGIVDNF